MAFEVELSTKDAFNWLFLIDTSLRLNHVEIVPDIQRHSCGSDECLLSVLRGFENTRDSDELREHIYIFTLVSLCIQLSKKKSFLSPSRELAL